MGLIVKSLASFFLMQQVFKQICLYLKGKTIKFMTEELMLAGSIKNNASAQEELYSRFSPRMLGVCYRFAKNREDAEDMLQEGFIKVFTQLHQYRNEGSLEGWIRRIVVHTCINVLKKNKSLKKGKFFNDLKEGLEEVIAYKKGKLTLRSELIEIPEPNSRID